MVRFLQVSPPLSLDIFPSPHTRYIPSPSQPRSFDRCTIQILQLLTVTPLCPTCTIQILQLLTVTPLCPTCTIQILQLLTVTPLNNTNPAAPHCYPVLSHNQPTNNLQLTLTHKTQCIVTQCTHTDWPCNNTFRRSCEPLSACNCPFCTSTGSTPHPTPHQVSHKALVLPIAVNCL